MSMDGDYDDEKDHAPSTFMEQENLTQGKTRSDSFDIMKTDSFNKVDSSNHFKTNQSAPPNNVEIPFVSRISNIIAKKKKECLKLYKQKLELIDQVNGLKHKKAR